MAAQNDQNHPGRVSASLGRRLAAAFLLYAVVGSLALLAWLKNEELRESHRVFAELTRSDVDFIRRLNLPKSGKLASDLSALLDMQVQFRPSAPSARHPDDIGNVPADSRIHKLEDGRDAIAHSLDAETEVVFIRPAPSGALATVTPRTMAVLGAFCLASLALAWAVSRTLVVPLRGLTLRLGQILGDPSVVIPEAGRADEIGALARALEQGRRELDEERGRREQADRLALLGRVATSLAHEIKNPLAAIQLHAQLLEHTVTGGSDDGGDESIRHILAESREIEGLVNQWLFLARPQAPQKVRLDISDILRALTSTLRAQADHAGVTLQLRAPDPPVLVLADRQRLAQAFRNPIVNAIQAMPEGGRLTISVECDSGSAHVRFIDAGRGFNNEGLRHAGELFFSDKEGGMGVGLNVAREIIRAHGGTTHLANRDDGASGAIVTLSLPLAPGESPSTSSRTSHA